MKRAWRRFLAYTRLNKSAVCEMSAGRGMRNDFHDYPDAVGDPGPMHFHTYKCGRCGKEFMI